jgi:hypothetical protein
MANIDRLYSFRRFLYSRLAIGVIDSRPYYEQSFYDNKHPGPHESMCYGCDEGRTGYVVKTRRKLGDIVLREEACEDCLKIRYHSDSTSSYEITVWCK